MINYGKMTEREYEEWFDKYLGEIECEDRDNSDSPLRNVPHPFRMDKWIKANLIVLGLSLTISLLTAQVENDWLVSWISNMCLNLSLGLFVSLFIFVFTNLRERNVAYYTDSIPLLKKRYRKLTDAYYQNCFRLNIYYNSSEFAKYHDTWHMLSNTCYVINDFYKYLLNTFPFNFEFNFELDNESISKEEISKSNNKILDANRKFQEDFYKDESISKKTHELCYQSTYYSFIALRALDTIIQIMEKMLFETKYGKKKKNNKISN